jgi:ubiquinone/menaquinone biosynthesis C-methylase UbiE
MKRLFQFLVDRVPFLSKALWKFWYNLAARIDNTSFELRFMNFGFAALDGRGETMPLSLDDEKHRYCIQQYMSILGGDSVAGLKMLEIGCGRGGGAAAIMKYAHPRSLEAMDLSTKAIEMCREHIRVPGLTFLPGSADQLPFGEGAFDAVVNIESSHCYPSVPGFLSEVKRVLKAGGRFYYADFRKRTEYGAWKRQIAGCGLRLVDEVDIRPNVLRALDLDSERKRGLIRSTVPKLLRGAFEKFACVQDSENYRNLKEGRWVYTRFILENSAPAGRAYAL